MSLGHAKHEVVRFSFPRVSGDEPNFTIAENGYAPFSPREWG